MHALLINRQILRAHVGRSFQPQPNAFEQRLEFGMQARDVRAAGVRIGDRGAPDRPALDEVLAESRALEFHAFGEERV